MSKFEDEIGKRHRVKKSGKKFYFTIMPKSIQFHASGEGDIANQEEYSQINTICRFISKCRGLGLSWVEVVKQLDSGSMGSSSNWPGILAQLVRDNFGIDQSVVGSGE